MRERLSTGTLALLLLICTQMAGGAARGVAGVAGAPSATGRGLAAADRADNRSAAAGAINPTAAQRLAAKARAVATVRRRGESAGPVDSRPAARGRADVRAVDGCKITAVPEAMTADLWPRSPGAGSAAAADTAAGATVTPADLARARHACRMARARFAELFGRPVPAVRILLWDRPGYRTGTADGGAAIFWPSSRAMTGRAAAAGAPEHYTDEQWRNVLPHETMHVLLAARFPAQEETGVSDGYGTPLPDWLDEGVAIWGESATNRRARLAQARALPASRRNLSSILTASHPAAGSPQAAAIRRGAAPPPDEALWTFYPQAIAVVTFLYDAGGREALRELVRRLITSSQAPSDAICGLPGLPQDFDDVVAKWDAWLAGG